MKRSALVMLTLMLVSALTVCGAIGDSPEKAAEEWAQAFANLDGNKVAERTCAAQQANVQQAGLWTSVFNLFGQQMIGQEAKTDVSGLRFTTVSSSGNTADVRVTGQIRVAVMALSQTQDVDETWRMVREDGKWKWCGEVGGVSVNMLTPTEVPDTMAQVPESTIVEVQANSDWQDTGVNVQIGEPVAITYVSGLWCPWSSFCLDGRGCVDVDPNVCSPDPNQPSNIFSFAHAGLIGRIGDGTPFAVGNGVTFQANQAGNIYLRINDRSIQDNSGALTVRLELGNIQPSQSGAVAQPTPAVKLLAYNYEIKDVGNGWNEGTLNFAFENITNGLIAGRSYWLADATVETQEGKSYPLTLFQYNWPGDPLKLEELDFSFIPEIIPPGFRWQNSKVWLSFRAAAAAHPTRIVFPHEPQFTINLAEAATPPPAFPAEAATLASAKPLSTLKDRVLLDQPGGLKVTLDGTATRTDQTVQLNYTVVNSDKLDERKGTAPGLPIRGYFIGGNDDTSFAAPGDIEPESIGEWSFSAGPGQTVHDAIFLNYFFDNRDQCVDVYAFVSEAPPTYDILKFWECNKQ